MVYRYAKYKRKSVVPYRRRAATTRYVKKRYTPVRRKIAYRRVRRRTY